MDSSSGTGFEDQRHDPTVREHSFCKDKGPADSAAPDRSTPLFSENGFQAGLEQDLGPGPYSIRRTYEYSNIRAVVYSNKLIFVY